MAFQLNFCTNINYAEAPGSSASWIRCLANDTNPGRVTNILNELLNGIYTPSYNNNISQGWRVAFPENVRGIGIGGCDYNNGIAHWIPNLRSCLYAVFSTQAEREEFNTVLANHTLVIKIVGKANIGGVLYPYPFYYFKKQIPEATTTSLTLISDVCLSDFTDLQSIIYSAQNSNVLDSSNCTLTFEIEAPSECKDLRSSLVTSEFLITLNGRNIEMEQESVHYRLLIQPDSQHASGTISLSSTDGIYSSFHKYDGASVRMLDDVCCHGAGYVEIYGDVEIVGWGISEVADVLIPVPRSLSRQNVLLLRANFYDECCCYATGYSDEITDLINNFMEGYSSYDSKTEILSAITPKSIKWSGFERLTDFCCDDSDCTQINDYEYRIEIPESSSGGGDSVDITCICDNLSLINSTLSAFRTDNKNALGSINSTLSQLNIDFDNACICDNLEGIKGSIDDVKEAIDNKELSVNNDITVQPCTPIVTNPVNNVTVQPSNPTINVQPCSPVVTNPVNNITVQPSNPTITVEPCTPTIQNNVQTDVQDIVDKMDELFKSDDKTITDIIKDKEMGSNIDVEVSPADDVNINRVYYTNQRNGDTNI